MPEEIASLRHHIHTYSKERGVLFQTEEFQNGYLFLDALGKEHPFQLCFLDIMMPALSGMDTAKELRQIDKDIPLIFCSSSTEYALMGYGVQASNYLVKPLRQEQVFRAMDDVLRKVAIQSERQLCFPTRDGLQRISPEGIAYIEASNNHAIIHLRHKEEWLCRLSFAQVTAMFQEEVGFVAISRSVLLNWDSVVGMASDEFVLETGEQIPIPRRKKKQLTQAFLDYSMGG